MSEDLAVYVHWPYCARICPYCDFNVYKRRDDAGLTSAILQDLSYWREWSGPRRVTSLHFGGGTPSLMTPADIAAVIDKTCSLWTPADALEIAIEANPADANLEHWTALRAAGVNRLSLGVQTFHDPALKMLGRDHDAACARAALDMAVDIFPSVSLDLIFGWAGQTQAQWAGDLNIAVRSGAAHISAYQLTIEDGTAFAKAEGRGERRAVGEDQSAGFYEQTETALTKAGYDHYEVSNYAKSGARSRHNLAYWQGQDYVGAGPGAHGRLTVNGKRYATIAALKPGEYQARVRGEGNGITEHEVLSPESWANEYALMGLRITDGISMTRFEAIAGYALPEDRITSLVDDGYLERESDKLRATASGRLVLNYITEQLLVGV